MINKLILRALCVLSLAVSLLTSCSVPVHFYLRNLTDEPVEVKVHLTDLEATIDDYPVLLIEEIEPLYFSSYKEMSPAKAIRDGSTNVYQLNLPPKSTFFVGKGINFSNNFFDKITIKTPKGEIVSLNDNNKEILLRGKTQPNRYYAWYDVR